MLIEDIQAVFKEQSAPHIFNALKSPKYQFDKYNTSKLLEILKTEKDTFLIFDQTPFYAEMGGQLGDTGTATIHGSIFPIVDTVKDKAGRYLHRLASGSAPQSPIQNPKSIRACRPQLVSAKRGCSS